MAIFDVKNSDNGNTEGGIKLAWAIRGGSNFWVTEKVAIRVQADLMSAVQSVGGGLYFGTGGEEPVQVFLLTPPCISLVLKGESL